MPCERNAKESVHKQTLRCGRNYVLKAKKEKRDMDFLEDILDSFRRKRRNGSSHYEGHHRHGQQHDDHHHQDRYDERHADQPNNGFLSCPKCSENLLPSYSFCPNCGSPAGKTLLCPTCKREVSTQSKFCPSCGNSVG
jgi:hypothetical protein